MMPPRLPSGRLLPGDRRDADTAVINAAINVQKKHPDWKMVPEIMIPLVGEVKELKYVKDVVVATADKIIKTPVST